MTLKCCAYVYGSICGINLAALRRYGSAVYVGQWPAELHACNSDRLPALAVVHLLLKRLLLLQSNVMNEHANRAEYMLIFDIGVISVVLFSLSLCLTTIRSVTLLYNLACSSTTSVPLYLWTMICMVQHGS